MNNFRRHILCNALVIAMGIGGAVSGVQAQEAPDRKSFDVPAQPAASALNAFAEQADITLVFSQDAVGRLTTPALEGEFTTIEGLTNLLKETGISIEVINDSTISLDIEDNKEVGYRNKNRGSENATSDTRDLETITVTGSHIQGGIPRSSPITVIDRTAIDQSGAATVQQLLQTLPQNFGGSASEVTAGTPGDSTSSQNLSSGAGVNLRGLGAGSTLVLVNGRRLADRKSTRLNSSH